MVAIPLGNFLIFFSSKIQGIIKKFGEELKKSMGIQGKKNSWKNSGKISGKLKNSWENLGKIKKFGEEFKNPGKILKNSGKN